AAAAAQQRERRAKLGFREFTLPKSSSIGFMLLVFTARPCSSLGCFHSVRLQVDGNQGCLIHLSNQLAPRVSKALLGGNYFHRAIMLSYLWSLSLSPRCKRQGAQKRFDFSFCVLLPDTNRRSDGTGTALVVYTNDRNDC
ncbi:unnamed protein product, partial [Ectocarpus sp. 6 AP-2014]